MTWAVQHTSAWHGRPAPPRTGRTGKSLVPRQMTAVLMIVSMTIATSAAVVGCGSRRGEPLGPPPPVATSERLNLGEQTFMTHCNACHPGGSAGLGPGLNDKPLPRWAIRHQVRSGHGAMPAFSEKRINDEQLTALVDYLKALRATPVEKVAVSR
jgi:mono/diheme cytochrome c family protein